MEFNTLHPMHHDRERGWKATPNPFAPKQPLATRYHTDKHIFVYANQLWYDIDATTNLLSRSRRSINDAQADTRQVRTIMNGLCSTDGLTST